MRPYYIIRFLYGLAAGELARDYIDYIDMVTNWDTNIAPVPPTLLVYTAAENKLINMAQQKSDAMLFYYQNNDRLLGAQAIQYGFDLKDTIELLLNAHSIEYHLRVWQTLNEEEDERYLEMLTLKEETNVTNISDVDVPTITPSEITTLLDDYNISEYSEILDYGWYYLTLVLGITEENAKRICIETHNFYFTDTISDFYLTHDIDEIIQTLVPENNFWAYNLDSNVTFDDTETQIPIDTAKTYAASWYVISDLGLITGGGFDVQDDGVYKIELILNIEEDSSINEARKTYVKIDINGTKHLIASGFQILCAGDVMTLNVSETLPLENGDNVSIFLNSDIVGETLNHISGQITITRVK